MITPGFSLTATERVLPRLALDFTTGVLDSRVTVTRALNTATRVNSSGYVETVNANLPRFDYDAVTLLPKGLLIEETRANLLLRSSEFNVSPWVLGVITPDTATAPDGTLTADTITFSGAGQYILQNVAITLGVIYTISFYIRTVTGTSNIKLVNDGGASVSSNIPVTDQWTRITFTSTSSRTGSAGHGLESAGASSFYIWGAQLEAGAFATSYIPTTTTSLTRNADAVTMTGTNFSDWYNQTEGSAAMNAVLLPGSLAAGNRRAFWFDNSSTGQYANAWQATMQPASSFVDVQVVSSSSLQSRMLPSITYAADQVVQIAAAMKTSGSAASVLGGTVSAVSTATLPVTLDTLRIGNHRDSTYINGWVQTFRYWPQRLINAEVQAFSKR